jgi:small conductance mechanosensitive channel
MDEITNTANKYADMITVLLTEYGLGVLGGIVVLIVGWTVAGWARRAVDRGLGKVERIDSTLRSFLASATRYVILVLTVLAVLSEFGVQTASLITVFGAASLAIGLALQGTLSNLAAGVMLLFFRPFHVGDYVEAGGHAGTVKAIDLFMSGVIAADERAHAEPEPVVVVGELADNSVNIVVRVWCDAGDYWGLKFDMTKAVKEALDKAGISIPFPQRTVHVAGGGGAMAAGAAE